MAPLSTRQPCPHPGPLTPFMGSLLAVRTSSILSKKHMSFTHLSLRHPTLTSVPGQLVQLEVSQWIHARPPAKHSLDLGIIQTLDIQQLTPGCDWQSYSSHWHWALQSPDSCQFPHSWFLRHTSFLPQRLEVRDFHSLLSLVLRSHWLQYLTP